jgi:hypothetical protein
MKLKTFGDKCGLGCGHLHWVPRSGCRVCSRDNDGLSVDPTTNQIKRTDQCLAGFPVEEKT